MQLVLIALLSLFFTLPLSAWAAPYIPKTDAEVLEQLPLRGENWFEIQRLKKHLADQPEDINTVLQLVRRYIELGRAESDPRYYGYAEAVLNPWLQTATPSPEAMTLRATLYQNRHDFQSASQLLNQVLQQQPRMAQAWLTLALIEQVQGKYEAAFKNCLPLIKLADLLTAQTCMASVHSFSGQLSSAYQQLLLVLVRSEHAATQEKLWAWTTLAEMAERKGDTVAAEQHYLKAFAIGRDAYLLNSYADFLLDQSRYPEVLDLLRDKTRADGFLLRLTLAEQQLKLPQSQAHIENLAARIAAGKLRGDTSHQGDEARFSLYLLRQPEAALKLAQQNWAVQREPRDARILLEAALAAKENRVQAQPVLDFIRQSQLEDVRLQALAQQFQGSSL